MNNTALQASLMTVLVVDDSDAIRKLLHAQLSLLGVTDIHMAFDGLDALNAINTMTHAPDVVICDIFMPNMDGIQFIGALAKLKYQGGLILITGASQNMLDVAQAIATASGLRLLGAATKPVQYQQLGDLLGFDALWGVSPRNDVSSLQI